MAHHSFTLEVSGIRPENPRFEDALFKAGCNDALVAVVDDKIYLDFDREAPTFDLAVASATRDVSSAGGQVVHVEPIEG
jgi:hypothetical protein